MEIYNNNKKLHLFFLADMLKSGKDLFFSQRSKAKPLNRIKAFTGVQFSSEKKYKYVVPSASALQGWDDFTEVVANQTEPSVVMRSICRINQTN